MGRLPEAARDLEDARYLRSGGVGKLPRNEVRAPREGESVSASFSCGMAAGRCGSRRSLRPRGLALTRMGSGQGASEGGVPICESVVLARNSDSMPGA